MSAIRLTVFCAFGLISFTAAAADPLEGEWQLKGIIDGGRREAKVPDLKMAFKAGRISRVGGNAAVAEIYTFDDTAKPPTIDFTLGGTKKPGIFEVKGDALRICFPDLRDEARRPASFDKNEFRVTVWELVRIKPGAEPKPAEAAAAVVGWEKARVWSVELEENVAAVGFSADGARVAVSEMVSFDREPQVRLYLTKSGKALESVADGVKTPAAPRQTLIAFDPNNPRLATATGANVTLRDAHTGASVKKLIEESKPGDAVDKEIVALAYSHDSKQLLISRKPGVVEVWSMESGKEAKIGEVNAGSDSAVALLPGNKLLTAEYHNRLHLWDAAKGTKLAERHPMRGILHAVAATADGRRAVIGGEGGAIVIDVDLDKPAIREHAQLLGHMGAIHAVAHAGKMKLFATSGSEGTVRLWSLDGQPYGVIWWPLCRYPARLAFSPAGELLLTARRKISPEGPSQGTVVELWELRKLLADETQRAVIASAAKAVADPLQRDPRNIAAALSASLYGPYRDTGAAVLKQAIEDKAMSERLRQEIQKALSQDTSVLLDWAKVASWSTAKDAPLKLLDEGDGKYEIVDDKAGAIIKAQNFYLYFALDDKFLADLPADAQDRVQVRMKVRHAARSQFDLEYDAHLAPNSKLDHDGRWTPTPKQPAGPDAWREVTFELPRAKLANRQNGGADFRIRADKGIEVRHVGVVHVPARKLP